MKIIRLLKYTHDGINGLVIKEAEEVEMKEGMAELALKYNNALTGGRYLAVDDFEKIYKPLNEQEDGKNSNVPKRKPSRRKDSGSTEDSDTGAGTVEGEN